MEDVLRDVLDSDKKTLVIALGNVARKFFEQDLRHKAREHPCFNAIDDIVRGRRNIKVLFLDKLQYLYMYLTYVEIEVEQHSRGNTLSSCEEIVIYGLESLVFPHEKEEEKEEKQEKMSPEQLRNLNLILHGAMRLEKRYAIRVRLVNAVDLGVQVHSWDALSRYWRRRVLE